MAMIPYANAPNWSLTVLSDWRLKGMEINNSHPIDQAWKEGLPTEPGWYWVTGESWPVHIFKSASDDLWLYSRSGNCSSVTDKEWSGKKWFGPVEIPQQN